jgi:hypothetical protein
MPYCLQKDEAHAPAASTTIRVRIVPRSVTTPATRPPCTSSPRAAQPCRTTPPRKASACAIRGAARSGSATPSEGEKTPPRQSRPVARPRSVASAADSGWLTTPRSRAK